MNDCIYRELLKSKIRAAFPSLKDRCRINEIVNAIPAADVVPVVHGRWVEKSTAMGMYFECSACGCAVWNVKPFLFGKGDYNFCPNCGAKMDGDGE